MAIPADLFALMLGKAEAKVQLAMAIWPSRSYQEWKAYAQERSRAGWQVWEILDVKYHDYDHEV